ncbi:hypothetical protein B0H12DRAFT_1070101 [Mycena haematopus]|nr:hypothetical protein B0H12DRAFT_1070101 [Mycena haematopus]
MVQMQSYMIRSDTIQMPARIIRAARDSCSFARAAGVIGGSGDTGGASEVPARGACCEYAEVRSISSYPRRISGAARDSGSLAGTAAVARGSGDDRADDPGDERTEAAGEAGQRAVLAGERNGFESRNESLEETAEVLRDEAATDGGGRNVDAEVEGVGEWTGRHGERAESAVRGVVGAPHGEAEFETAEGGKELPETDAESRTGEVERLRGCEILAASEASAIMEGVKGARGSAKSQAPSGRRVATRMLVPAVWTRILLKHEQAPAHNILTKPGGAFSVGRGDHESGRVYARDNFSCLDLSSLAGMTRFFLGLAAKVKVPDVDPAGLLGCQRVKRVSGVMQGSQESERKR